ncbi:MAG: winged helix-turn-helix transcriptional regulator, partial [Erysipelotrichaceae bacterium]|nr:winged helix-turn-helix transcriptional regulator [Erysipelotrichaceae bacterium]
SGHVSTKVLTMKDLVLDLDMHTVTLRGEEIVLTLKEFELLELFMQNIGHAFTREQLLEKIWEEEYLGGTRTIDVHVGTLRTKLKDYGDSIQTVRGVGYRMEPVQ